MTKGKNAPKESSAAYVGSFDPVTKGHEHVIEEGLKIFSKIYIGVGQSQSKSYVFSAEDRLAMLRELFAGDDRVEVHAFDGLSVNFAKRMGVQALLRGVRNQSDFNYEATMALANNKLADEISTIFIPARAEYLHISSSLVREIALSKGNLASFVSPGIEKWISKKFR
ncbi:MAG: pantetheine-phosphate adenylyltransferase [Oligoflexales bacterium]